MIHEPDESILSGVPADGAPLEIEIMYSEADKAMMASLARLDELGAKAERGEVPNSQFIAAVHEHLDDVVPRWKAALEALEGSGN